MGYVPKNARKLAAILYVLCCLCSSIAIINAQAKVKLWN